MIIETENDALAEVGDERVRDLNDGEAVEFNDEGRARVPAEVGEYIAESREGVRIAKDERTETTETTE